MREPKKTKIYKKIILLFFTLAVAVGFVDTRYAQAEYGDIVINNFSDPEGIRPVVFPHWFHRLRFRCKVCHGDLGFKFKAGGNKIQMINILEGEFCGACHNDEISWGPENCDLCHSGIPGIKTQVHGGTKQILVAPISKKRPVSKSAPQRIAIEKEEAE